MRERVVDSTDVTWYRWDAGYRMIAQYDDPNTDWTLEGLQYTFPHDPSRLFGTALAVDAGANPATGAYRYFLQDAYGSTRQLRLQDKSLAGAWGYSPYGALYHGGGTESVFAYTGQIHDPNAGLYYFPFRHYNPALARWLTPEPTGADGPNMYWYGLGNPVAYVDILGLWTVGIDFVLSGGFGNGGTIGISLNFDGHGGVSLNGTVGAGGYGGASGSWTVGFMGTTADSVSDLSGTGFAVGGSVGEVLVGAFDVIGSKGWVGTRLGGGMGAGLSPVEVHGFVTQTVCLAGS